MRNAIRKLQLHVVEVEAGRGPRHVPKALRALLDELADQHPLPGVDRPPGVGRRIDAHFTMPLGQGRGATAIAAMSLGRVAAFIRALERAACWEALLAVTGPERYEQSAANLLEDALAPDALHEIDTALAPPELRSSLNRGRRRTRAQQVEASRKVSRLALRLRKALIDEGELCSLEVLELVSGLLWSKASQENVQPDRKQAFDAQRRDVAALRDSMAGPSIAEILWVLEGFAEARVERLQSKPGSRPGRANAKRTAFAKRICAHLSAAFPLATDVALTRIAHPIVAAAFPEQDDDSRDAIRLEFKSARSQPSPR